MIDLSTFTDFDIGAELATDVYNFLRDPVEVAGKLGLQIFYPEPNELQIDIDSEEDYTEFENRFAEFSVYLEDEWGKLAYSVRPSKSGLPKRHVSLFARHKTFSEEERILYQFMFGSDAKREMLNALRCAMKTGIKPCFFEPNES